MKRRILIIDDELSTCTLLSLALRQDYDVKYATTAMDGLAMIEHDSFDLVLLDLIIGNDNGVEVLKQIKKYDESIVVIMMTAFGSIKTSVEAMKNGAFTYLSKPLDVEEVRVFIEQALTVRRLNDDVGFLSGELKKRFQYKEMIGKSPRMQQVYGLIEKLKDIDSNVTITGESGTGKELVARAIHFSGKRSKERFVVINCAAIPENLLEEELFGHKRGSFTGATHDKKGKFEIADRGTVFLDEIGDMPLGLQSKLLRVIQQKEFTALGCSDVRKVDVRIVAATNRNLANMVREGKFREDLYYRLNVVNIPMPALRERKEDIPLLCRHFIKQFNREQNKSVKRISPEAEKQLYSYDYPGNVRQLGNILEYAMILSNGEEIGIENLPLEMKNGLRPIMPRNSVNSLKDMLAGMPIKQIESIAIEATLSKNGGRRDLTAKELGISVRSLQNKIIEYGIKV
ncbi:MAG TPA: sigma-54 dependent transcriptional regulator [Spirochaetales bacterium]|jgi:two-component system response regulator AtoC|nr:sigma-54 dependent transcriptional regulator [Spirochaetales bacterium]HQK34692.1 sigma-54 dependent transcriptional regulator [Spirochaetales bacterium]HQO69718.1 sigma-54 dependent transcriptional regulator [Clostridia bacterium]